MAEQWQVTVDRSVCMGTGMCRGIVPRLFVDGGDGKTNVTQDLVEPDELVIDAAETCPTEAITVTDSATGKVLAPEI
ncbi:MAG TPA: ferredoxin [Streptosporangiaceae bacterium]|nr:ferredoxin [Streptosporangiaceae bacterium]